MKKATLHTKPADKYPAQTDKRPYETPVLKEHGNAKEVTLQTFFGTFSPGSPTGNS